MINEGKSVTINESIQNTGWSAVSITVLTYSPLITKGTITLLKRPEGTRTTYNWRAFYLTGKEWKIKGDGAKIGAGRTVPNVEQFPFETDSTINNGISAILVKWLNEATGRGSGQPVSSDSVSKPAVVISTAPIVSAPLAAQLPKPASSATDPDTAVMAITPILSLTPRPQSQQQPQQPQQKKKQNVTMKTKAAPVNGNGAESAELITRVFHALCVKLKLTDTQLFDTGDRCGSQARQLGCYILKETNGVSATAISVFLKLPKSAPVYNMAISGRKLYEKDPEMQTLVDQVLLGDSGGSPKSKRVSLTTAAPKRTAAAPKTVQPETNGNGKVTPIDVIRFLLCQGSVATTEELAKMFDVTEAAIIHSVGLVAIDLKHDRFVQQAVNYLEAKCAGAA